MSDPTDTSPAGPSATGDAAALDECERPWCGAGPLPANLTARPTMPVGWLTAHPGNVRAGLDLSAEFVASIAENGVLVPLRITIDGEGDAERYRVIDGHRAPRGASLYPRHSREGLEGRFLGLMALPGAER